MAVGGPPGLYLKCVPGSSERESYWYYAFSKFAGQKPLGLEAPGRPESRGSHNSGAPGHILTSVTPSSSTIAPSSLADRAFVGFCMGDGAHKTPKTQLQGMIHVFPDRVRR